MVDDKDVFFYLAAAITKNEGEQPNHSIEITTMRSKTIFERYPIATIALFTLIMLSSYFSHWSVSIMEARSFITAREMLLNDNWLLTTMNGLPRYQKPPLPTWLSAISASVFGVNSLIAMRLPTAIMVFLVGVFTYRFSVNFLSKENGLTNALIVITSFYILGITVEAPWDIYTHGFILAAIFFMYRAFEKSSFKDITYAVLLCAFSVMSKGPIGVFALFIPFVLAYFFTYKYSNQKLFKILSVLIVGSMLGAIWFLYVRLADPAAFNEITSRETQNWSSYNVRPFYYYWSFFVQSGIWTLPAIAGLVYPYMISRVENRKAYKLTFLWTIFSVILLSCVPEKKSRYLVPVLIPLAMNTGFYIQYLFKRFRSGASLFDKIIVNLHFALLALVGVGSGVGAVLAYKSDSSMSLVVLVVSVMILTTIGVYLVNQLLRREVLNLFLSSVVLFVAIMFTLPLIFSTTSKQADFLKAVEKTEQLGQNPLKPIYFLDAVSPEFLWYCQRIVLQVEHKYVGDKAEYTLPSEQQFGLLVEQVDEMNMAEWQKVYDIKKLDLYDVNIPTGHRKKDRYMSHFFLFTKK